jgi:hypothetical protein
VGGEIHNTEVFEGEAFHRCLGRIPVEINIGGRPPQFGGDRLELVGGVEQGWQRLGEPGAIDASKGAIAKLFGRI